MYINSRKPIENTGQSQTAQKAQPQQNSNIGGSESDSTKVSQQTQKDQLKADAAQGSAQNSYEISDPLTIEWNGNSATVTGFPAGGPPAMEEVIRQAFPMAESIELISQEHTRPFSNYIFEVDGDQVSASFLTGGFAPSNSIQLEILDESQPVPEDMTPPPAQQPQTPEVSTPQAQPPAEFMVSPLSEGVFLVHGPRGYTPDFDQMIELVFPHAENVEFLGSESEHPYFKQQFKVDGQLYESSFMTGGFQPSGTTRVTRMD